MNDLISRQAAIDAVLSVIPDDEYWKEQVEIAVNNLPSAVVPIKDKCLTCIYCENCTDEQTFEEFMFGQEGNPEDGSL